MKGPVFTAIPWTLTSIRLLLAPVMIGAAVGDAPRVVFLVALATAFWFDIADGVCARRFGVDTPALRRFDALTDVIFFLSVLVCVLVAEPAIFWDYRWHFIALVGCESVCQSLSLVRFGCTTSTHSWLCKAWAVMLFFAAARILGTGEAGWPVDVALTFPVLAYLDVLLILLVSRQSPTDVPTSWHAWRRIRAAAPVLSVESEAERVH